MSTEEPTVTFVENVDTGIFWLGDSVFPLFSYQGNDITGIVYITLIIITMIIAHVILLKKN